MTIDTNYLGIQGEEAAAQFLERLDMRIIERNWQAKHGEADIIAVDDDELVFVEVKTRLNESKGKPEDAVDKKKRDRYAKLAIEYLSKHDEFSEYPVRFDVIGITVISEDKARLRHHRAAFMCD